MSAPAAGKDGVWGWRLVKAVTILVYIFMFAPIIVTIVLSFNASMFGGFPMTGLSLHWYGRLLANEADGQSLDAWRQFAAAKIDANDLDDAGY